MIGVTNRNNELFDQDNYEEGGGVGHARFKEEDEHLDLLKDIRKQQNDQQKKKVKKDNESKQGEDGTEGNADANAATGEGAAEGDDEK